MYIFSHLKVSVLVILVITNVINAEDYEDYDNDNNASASIDSDSKEIFNFTSKEKPHKIQIKKVIVNVHNNDSGLSITHKDYPDNLNNTYYKEINFKKSLPSFSFTVSIQKKGSHYTSGALVDKNWIISSAEQYFYVRESIKLFKVRLGSVNCKKGGLLIPLKGIEIHPYYEYKQPSFDLSLIKLAKPMEFNNVIRPISLSTVQGEIVQAKFLTAYWPVLIVKGSVLSTSAKERIKSTSMRISTQKLIPLKKCKRLFKTMNQTLDTTSLCLEPFISHHSRCQPDPGAPIVADDSLWGVTSGWTSDNCNKQPSPTLVTSTSAETVHTWIVAILEGVKKHIL